MLASYITIRFNLQKNNFLDTIKIKICLNFFMKSAKK